MFELSTARYFSLVLTYVAVDKKLNDLYKLTVFCGSQRLHKLPFLQLIFYTKTAKKAFSDGASPQTPLGQLTALPQTPYLY